MRLQLLVSLVFASFYTASSAGADCDSFIGQTVQPQSIGSAMDRIAALGTPKDEFETTTAYEARIAAILAAMPSKLIVELPVDEKYVAYDADAQAYEVQAYAIDNRGANYRAIFGWGAPFQDFVKFDQFSNVDIVVPEAEVLGETYTASNAYGVSVQVREVKRVDDVIFERAATLSENTFQTENSSGRYDPLFVVSMSANEAKAMKGKMRAAAVVSPKKPYYAAGKEIFEPTIDNPREVTQFYRVMIADITCGLWLGPKGNVLSSVTAR